LPPIDYAFFYRLRFGGISERKLQYISGNSIMGCVPSKKCVEPNVIKQVVEKPTTVASILEAVPFLLKNIPTDVLRTNLLPYLSNSYEPDALTDQNLPNIICKYYSDGEDMIYTLVRYGSIENWNTSKINLPFVNETIRVAVEHYLKGDNERIVIIKKYGEIEKWDVSNVTDMSKVTYVPEFVALNEVIPHIEYLPLDNTIAKKLLPESHVCKRYRWNTQMKKFDGKKPFRPKTRSHKGNKMRY
jgi:hypothetical protein